MKKRLKSCKNSLDYELKCHSLCYEQQKENTRQLYHKPDGLLVLNVTKLFPGFALSFISFGHECITSLWKFRQTVSESSHHYCRNFFLQWHIVCRFDGRRVIVSILRCRKQVFCRRFCAVHDIHSAAVRTAGTSWSILQVDLFGNCEMGIVLLR